MAHNKYDFFTSASRPVPVRSWSCAKSLGALHMAVIDYFGPGDGEFFYFGRLALAEVVGTDFMVFRELGGVVAGNIEKKGGAVVHAPDTDFPAFTQGVEVG